MDDVSEIAFLKVVTQYSQLAAFTILYYDYFVTLRDEVLLFWGPNCGKRTGFLFHMNRYIQLLGNIPIVLQNFAKLSTKGCQGLLVYHECFVIATQAIVGCVLVMRTYAIFERQIMILLVLFAIVVVLIIIAVWAVFTPSHASQFTVLVPSGALPLLGCQVPLSVEQAQRTALVWEGMLFADTVVLSLTAYRAYRLRKSSANNILGMLLRDGFVYYLAISVANSLNIITLLSSKPIIRGAATTVANVVSTTSISRLMLSLRSRALLESSAPSSQNQLTTELRFTTLDYQRSTFPERSRHDEFQVEVA